MFKDSIFREYDIRGVYQIDFDNTFAYHLGKAYGFFLKEKGQNENSVSIGHDARLSSPEIAEALVQGITSCGIKVFFLGLITTPMSYFSLFHLNISSGIMVTGSHNPPEYNGFKLSMGKSTIFGNQIQKLKEFLKSETLSPGNKTFEKNFFQKKPGKLNGFKGLVEHYDISTDYIDRYKKEFQIMEDPNVILDCGNGSAGVIARRLYNAVGLDPEVLFEKPDGRFPNHHPDPTVEENTKDMKKIFSQKRPELELVLTGMQTA